MLAIDMSKETHEDMSPEAREAYIKLTHGMRLSREDYELWLSPQEAALFLSWKKTKDTGQESHIPVRYVRELVRQKRLEHGPNFGRAYRYRLEKVLQVPFDPRGPKPKDRSARRGEGLS